MEKIKNKLILVIFLVIIIIFPLVSAENTSGFTAIGTKSCVTTTESCSSNTDCCQGLSCYSGVCQKTPNVEICYNQEDDDGDDLMDCFDRDCKDSTYCGGDKNEIETNNNQISSALIIALGIIVGLVILGLLIKKRK